MEDVADDGQQRGTGSGSEVKRQDLLNQLTQ